MNRISTRVENISDKNGEPIRDTSTVVTKKSMALPLDNSKYKKSREAWNWEKIVDLIFPQEQSPKRNKYAKTFLEELMREGSIGSEKLNRFDEWGHEKGQSNLVNYILPKLRRAGMIKYEYTEFRDRNEGERGRKKIIKPASGFTSSLKSMVSGWSAFESRAMSD